MSHIDTADVKYDCHTKIFICNNHAEDGIEVQTNLGGGRPAKGLKRNSGSTMIHSFVGHCRSGKVLTGIYQRTV